MGEGCRLRGEATGLRSCGGALALALSLAILAGCSRGKPTPPPAGQPAPASQPAAPAEDDPTAKWWLPQSQKPAAPQQAPAVQPAPEQAPAAQPAATPAAAPAAVAPLPAAVPSVVSQPAPSSAPAIVSGSYPATFQASDQKGFAAFNQPTDFPKSLQGLWSPDKSQCNHGIALDPVQGYGTFTVDTNYRGVGTFEERLDDVNSIYLHRDWIGRFYLARSGLVLLSAGGNRIQRTAYRVTSFGSDSLGYDKKEVWTYDLWEGTLLAASATGPGTLVRCDTADINAAYLAGDPDLAKRVEAFRTEAKARDAETTRREAEAGRVFMDQKRFDDWLAQKKTDYKADLADGLLRQPPLVADQRYWLIGNSVPVGVVRLGAVQTSYARMRYQANDESCLKNNQCPEYMLVMRDADAGKFLRQNAEVRALVGKFVGVVTSSAGTPAPIFEPVELYPGK